MSSVHAAPSDPLVTGHPGIDAQHDRLLALTGKLGDICVTTEHHGSASPCATCVHRERSACAASVAELIGDLLGFMIEHASYEEGLMRRLPATPVCRQHVEAHTFAHAEISHRLSELTFGLDEANPHGCAHRLQNIVVAWLGSHAARLNRPHAAELEMAYVKEISLDVELAGLLAASPS